MNDVMTRRRLARIAGGLLGSFLFASLCAANEELAAKSRPAQRTDVLGNWQMTYQVVSSKVKDDSLFFAEHQVWSFSTDGYARNIASTKPQRISEIMALFKTMPQQTTFQFAKDGVLFIHDHKRTAI